MSEAFKINIYFDEKGEELEEIIKKFNNKQRLL